MPRPNSETYTTVAGEKWTISNCPHHLSVTGARADSRLFLRRVREIVQGASPFRARSSAIERGWLSWITAGRVMYFPLFDDPGDFDGRTQRQSRVVVVDGARAGECQCPRNDDDIR